MSLLVADDPANESDDGLLFFSGENNQLGDHPIMMGRNKSEQVDRVLTFTGQSLKGPAESVPLLKFANTAIQGGDGASTSAAGRSQGLRAQVWQGPSRRTAQVMQLSAQVYGNPPIAAGMNVPGCDNRRWRRTLCTGFPHD